jgi:hypothetical protein
MKRPLSGGPGEKTVPRDASREKGYILIRNVSIFYNIEGLASVSRI